VTKKRKPGSLRPYTTGEIAEELGVHPSTVIAMLERGEIPWYWSDQEHQRGRRLVRVKDWNAWKRKQAG
jgi:excisionase family DNA binding protein